MRKQPSVGEIINDIISLDELILVVFRDTELVEQCPPETHHMTGQNVRRSSEGGEGRTKWLKLGLAYVLLLSLPGRAFGQTGGTPGENQVEMPLSFS